MNKRIDQLLTLLGAQDSVILPRAALSSCIGSAFCEGMAIGFMAGRLQSTEK